MKLELSFFWVYFHGGLDFTNTVMLSGWGTAHRAMVPRSLTTGIFLLQKTYCGSKNLKDTTCGDKTTVLLFLKKLGQN